MKRHALVVCFSLLALVGCTLATQGPAPTSPPSTATAAPPTRAASATEPATQSEHRCGDGVCDGPENPGNCPEDCEPEPVSEEGGRDEEEEQPDPATRETTAQMPETTILYHLVEHAVSSNEMSGETCWMFNFRRFLDGGRIRTDGTGNEVLHLKDHPTSQVTAKAGNAFYYISSPNDPVMESFGIAMFNWDVEGQTLWSADFAHRGTSEIASSRAEAFPGGVTTSPGNQHLLYVMTQRKSDQGSQAGVGISDKMNPFLSDSSLILQQSATAEQSKVLTDRYNRQLFASFSDLSPDGSFFYTLAREAGSFSLVRISLNAAQTAPFQQVFPAFDWASLNWDDFFPPADDFSYASFTISPDEGTLVAYKNNFTANLDNPCFSAASHDLWVFDLQQGTMDRTRDRAGYVTDSAWHPDSTQFALAIVGNSGCYPDYLDAKIDTFNTEGEDLTTLVEEPKSKITTMGWSPDGESIVYDVYSTDFVGRLKAVGTTSTQVSEIINTQTLGYDVDRSTPVTLLFADWVVEH